MGGFCGEAGLGGEVKMERREGGSPGPLGQFGVGKETGFLKIKIEFIDVTAI